MFLISMEDEIMQLFGSERIIDAMENYDIPEDEYISGESLSRAFKQAQDFVDSKDYDSRLYLYKYDSVGNFQRAWVYGLRDQLLENQPKFLEFLKAAVRQALGETLSLGDPELIAKDMLEIFRVEARPEEIKNYLGVELRQERQQAFNEWLNPFYAPA